MTTRVGVPWLALALCFQAGCSVPGRSPDWQVALGYSDAEMHAVTTNRLGFPLVEIRVNGEPLQVLLDTGNMSGLFLSADVIRGLGLPERSQVATRDSDGRYNPVVDMWTATGTGTGVPDPHDSHTAVWTGTEMIVWGGVPATATGGICCVDVRASLVCDDGNACTSGDTCGGGTCNSGSPITAPPETEGVTASADKATYNWSASAFATRYDVLRGSTAALPVGPGGGDELCFDNLPGPSWVDPSVPVSGTGFWYLSRGENECGNGSFGQQSNGTPRVSTTCP
jgi:hypothetical protein